MSHNNPLVSIIIPVYNSEKYLINCLNSVLNQTYSHWEAIVIDDGSTDSSSSICDNFEKKDNRFNVFHIKNQGVSYARNLGLSKSKGNYIFYLDSDDYLHEEALTILLNIAARYNAEIVQCSFIKGTETSFPKITDKIETKKYDNHTIFSSFNANIIPWGKLYKREVVKDIQFPVGLRNEDDFTTWKFYYNVKTRIIVINLSLYYYTDNNQSYMASQKKRPNLKYFDAYRERIDFFEEKRETELVALSRIQWLKSLVSVSSNKNLSKEQKKEIKREFKNNFKELKKSGYKYPKSLKLLFESYNVIPRLTGLAIYFYLNKRTYENSTNH